MLEIKSLIKYFRHTDRADFLPSLADRGLHAQNQDKEVPALEEALSMLEDKASHKLEIFLRR